MANLFFVYVFFRSFFCGCNSDNKQNSPSNPKQEIQITKIGKFDPVVNESSGIVFTDSAGTKSIYTLNDSGGKAAIYKTSLSGQLLETINIPNARNRDWEDLTIDDSNIFYIGDIGNNDNRRQNLCIYKYDPSTTKTEEIKFSYQDQHTFPPKRDSLNFDCEAFFSFSDSLYLFSKNRGKKVVKVYKVPSVAGSYKTEVKDSVFLSTMITGAAINPSKSAFALLGYGKIYLFEIRDNSINFNHFIFCKNFPMSGQSEGIDFLSDNELIITNEGRAIYKVRLKYK